MVLVKVVQLVVHKHRRSHALRGRQRHIAECPRSILLRITCCFQQHSLSTASLLLALCACLEKALTPGSGSGLADARMGHMSALNAAMATTANLDLTTSIEGRRALVMRAQAEST